MRTNPSDVQVLLGMETAGWKLSSRVCPSSSKANEELGRAITIEIRGRDRRDRREGWPDRDHGSSTLARILRTAAMQGVIVLQPHLPLPQASQLAQSSSAGSNKSERCGRSALASSSSSQFAGGGSRAVRARDSEPCSSSNFGCGAGVKVLCMAKERRVKMVSQQIKREISEMLLYDKVVQAAVLPETALGADMYLTAVATISDVEMSKDLSVAKVYISIYGDERGQEKALAALKNKAGYVRKGLAQRMNLKNTPEVRFIKDESLERGSRVIGLLDKLKQERQLKEGTGPEREEDEDVDGDEEDDHEGDEEIVDEVEEDKSVKAASRPRDDGDESDWEDDENITFIR